MSIFSFSRYVKAKALFGDSHARLVIAGADSGRAFDARPRAPARRHAAPADDVRPQNELR